jgi:hypothetical protein
MSLAIHPIIGTIGIEPLADAPAQRRLTDDSTLGSLLASFAVSEMLWDDDGAPPVHLVASTRISRRKIQDDREIGTCVGADLSQLLDELQAEYDELLRSAD